MLLYLHLSALLEHSIPFSQKHRVLGLFKDLFRTVEWLLQKLWVPRVLIYSEIPSWRLAHDVRCLAPWPGWHCVQIPELLSWLSDWLKLLPLGHWNHPRFFCLSCLGLISLSSEWLWGNSPKTCSIHAYVLHIYMSKHIQNSWGVLFADSRWILTKVHMEILLHRALGQVPPLSVPCLIMCEVTVTTNWGVKIHWIKICKTPSSWLLKIQTQ